MTRSRTMRAGRVTISQELLLRDLGLNDGVITNAYYDLDRLEFVLVVQHPKMPAVRHSQPIPRVQLVMQHNTSTGRNTLVKVQVEGIL